MNFKVISPILFSLVIVFSTNSYSTPIEDYEQRKRFERQQELLKEEQNFLGSDYKSNLEKSERKGACISVGKIDVEGVTLFSKGRIETLTNKYSGDCLYLADMNSIMNEISALYIDKGYITSRAYLPEQNLSDGSLLINVVEGKLDDIKEETEDENSSIFNSFGFDQQLTTAFPLMHNKFLNIRDIEQGLDQINRLQSNNATMEITPSSSVGGSILNIQNERKKPWKITSSVDNSGSKNTGVWQAAIDASFDDLLGLNDYMSYGFKSSLDDDEWTQSKNHNFRYDIPFGYWNFAYRYSYFSYVNKIEAIGIDYKSNGTSRENSLSADYILHRDQMSKTALRADLKAKETVNYFNNVRLGVSSRKLTIADIGLSHSRRISNGFILGSLTYSRGLKLLGSLQYAGSGNQNPQFDRLTLDTNFIKQFDFGWENYNPRLDIIANATYSPDRLYSSEQISIGGPYSVRGFKEESISGDNGAYARFELATSMPHFENAIYRNSVGLLKPYVGFDIGSIFEGANENVQTGTLTSATLGLKGGNDVYSLDVSFSKPLYEPDFVNEGYGDFLARLSVSF